MPIHRAELHRLARTRVREATALFAAREWSGAYYLSGYAVELGLKAALAKQFRAGDFPDKDLVKNIFIHDLDNLVGLAGLRPQLSAHIRADPTFELNWQLVKDWRETARYQHWTRTEAEEMLGAIKQRRHGVMTWLRSVW